MKMFGNLSSSLSDKNPLKSRMNKPSLQISKQHLSEQKMFGSKRKGIQIGKKFKRGMSSKLTGDMKSSGISPSIEEFDKMMSNVAGKNSKGFSKKSMFSKNN